MNRSKIVAIITGRFFFNFSDRLSASGANTRLSRRNETRSYQWNRRASINSYLHLYKQLTQLVASTVNYSNQIPNY